MNKQSVVVDIVYTFFRLSAVFRGQTDHQRQEKRVKKAKLQATEPVLCCKKQHNTTIIYTRNSVSIMM